MSAIRTASTGPAPASRRHRPRATGGGDRHLDGRGVDVGRQPGLEVAARRQPRQRPLDHRLRGDRRERRADGLHGARRGCPECRDPPARPTPAGSHSAFRRPGRRPTIRWWPTPRRRPPGPRRSCRGVRPCVRAGYGGAGDAGGSVDGPTGLLGHVSEHAHRALTENCHAADAGSGDNGRDAGCDRSRAPRPHVAGDLRPDRFGPGGSPAGGACRPGAGRRPHGEQHARWSTTSGARSHRPRCARPCTPRWRGSASSSAPTGWSRGAAATPSTCPTTAVDVHRFRDGVARRARAAPDEEERLLADALAPLARRAPRGRRLRQPRAPSTSTRSPRSGSPPPSGCSSCASRRARPARSWASCAG